MDDVEALRSTLARFTTEGTILLPMANDWVQCVACNHRCRIPPGREGICKVRFNAGGTLRVPRGYVAGLAVDPIEKKPFFHVLPGSETLSYGMLGCDYHCAYCQNWITSQAIRDAEAQGSIHPITAGEIVGLAVQKRVPIVTSTYNEPLITSEWNAEVFRAAREKNLRCAYVSNGNSTPEVLSYLKPVLDFCKVDLKSFRKKNYQQLGGTLDAVLVTIRSLVELKIWVEVVTLIIPGFNDSEEELRDIAAFLRSVSADIPWHVTAFHQDYRMTDHDPTSAATLVRAAGIGKDAGLHYVYAGNIPKGVGDLENTYCPGCGTLLLERWGFRVRSNHLEKGSCPGCRLSIPGIWQ